jgi:hypothetical protein
LLAGFKPNVELGENIQRIAVPDAKGLVTAYNFRRGIYSTVVDFVNHPDIFVNSLLNTGIRLQCAPDFA